MGREEATSGLRCHHRATPGACEERKCESEVQADFPGASILDIFGTGSNLRSEGPAAVGVVCHEHGAQGGLEEVVEGLWCSESLDMSSKGPSKSGF